MVRGLSRPVDVGAADLEVRVMGAAQNQGKIYGSTRPVEVSTYEIMYIRAVISGLGIVLATLRLEWGSLHFPVTRTAQKRCEAV